MMGRPAAPAVQPPEMLSLCERRAAPSRELCGADGGKGAHKHVKAIWNLAATRTRRGLRRQRRHRRRAATARVGACLVPRRESRFDGTPILRLAVSFCSQAQPSDRRPAGGAARLTLLAFLNWSLAQGAHGRTGPFQGCARPRPRLKDDGAECALHVSGRRVRCAGWKLPLARAVGAGPRTAAAAAVTAELHADQRLLRERPATSGASFWPAFSSLVRRKAKQAWCKLPRVYGRLDPARIAVVGHAAPGIMRDR